MPSVLWNKYRAKSSLRATARQAVSHQAGIDRDTQWRAHRQAKTTHYRPTEDTGREVSDLNLVKRFQRRVSAFLSLMPRKHSVVPPRLSSMHLKDTTRNIPNSQAAQRPFRKSKLTTSVHPCSTLLSSLTSYSASCGQGCLFLPGFKTRFRTAHALFWGCGEHMYPTRAVSVPHLHLGPESEKKQAKADLWCEVLIPTHRNSMENLKSQGLPLLNFICRSHSGISRWKWSRILGSV